MGEKKKCLLIVDDEEDFRYTARQHFERRRYVVLEAANGEEALERFEEDRGRIALVITDIRMPGMGGKELIHRLRSRNSLLPIIGITGHDDIKSKLSSLGEGAYYFIDKPLLDHHWPFVDRLVDNAIKLHEREREVEAFRATERKIARMLRSYILKRPLDRPSLQAERVLRPEASDKPSGDYVECFHRSRDELLFYVADASGHKNLLPAFTACLSSMVLHRVHHGRRPTVREIIQEIDQALEDLRKAKVFGMNRFLTFLIGCLNLRNGELTYVNAGHPPAFLFREGTEVIRLEPTCPPVGLVALTNTEIEQGTALLRPGDLLFLYTDGVTTSLKEKGESDHSPVCIKRLEELVRPLAAEPLQELADEVMAQLRSKVGKKGFQDDTTLLAIRLHEARG